MDNKSIQAALNKASSLLNKEMLNVGMYGKHHVNHKINESRKFVAKNIKKNSEAISTLMFEDRNAYKEDDVYHKIKLLDKFIDAKRDLFDLETYKKLRNSVGKFVKE